MHEQKVKLPLKGEAYFSRSNIAWMRQTNSALRTSYIGTSQNKTPCSSFQKGYPNLLSDFKKDKISKKLSVPRL